MSGTELFEREVADRLHRRADQAPVGDGWAGIEHRVARRHRRRQAVRSGVAVLAVVVVAGAAAVLAGPGARDGQQVASGSGGGPLRLALDVSWLAPVHVESYETQALGAPGGVQAVLVDAGAGFAGRVVFVQTVPEGAAFGFGEASPEAVEVDVSGQTGYLGHTTPIASTLGWRLPAGSGLEGVYLGALRMADDELVTVARSLTVAGGAVTVPPGGLAGLAEAGFLHRGSAPGETNEFAEVTYEGEGAWAQLRVHHGSGPGALADLVLDRALSAGDASEVAVRGTTGVLVTYHGEGGARTLMWADRGGAVVELTLDEHTPTTRIDEAIASIRELSEAEWQAIVDELGGPRSVDTTITVPPVDTLHVLQELCQARASWLEADAAGDADLRGAAQADADTAREAAVAAGVGEVSDLEVVFERLIEAMARGDAAHVRAVPEGGGCP